MSNVEDVILAAVACVVLSKQRRPRRYWERLSLHSKATYSGNDLLDDLNTDDVDPLSGELRTDGSFKNFVFNDQQEMTLESRQGGPSDHVTESGGGSVGDGGKMFPFHVSTAHSDRNKCCKQKFATPFDLYRLQMETKISFAITEKLCLQFLFATRVLNSGVLESCLARAEQNSVGYIR
ncbi:hypothetical protein J6590_064673 [Homalodisca vitripennis]|nr:hypothetical protein J6590_064673 [Homalodisca vitripennis]